MLSPSAVRTSATSLVAASSTASLLAALAASHWRSRRRSPSEPLGAKFCSRSPGDRANRRGRRLHPASPQAHARPPRPVARGLHAQGAPDPSRSNAVMKPAPSSAALEHRLERAVERRIAGAVLKVRDQDRNRFVRAGRAAREIPVRHRQHPAAWRSHRPCGSPTTRLIGHQLAGLIESIEVGDQRCGRLVALRGIRLDAPHHESIQRLGDLRDDRPGPAGGGCSIRSCSSAMALTACPARRRPSEHVVKDQAERVNVGALIDRLSMACSGAMYSTVPITLPTMVAATSREFARPRRRASAAPVDPRRRALGASAPRRPRDPEVHDHRVTRLDHDIGGLEIAMDHAGFVRGDRPATIGRAMRSTCGTGEVRVSTASRDPRRRCTAS